MAAQYQIQSSALPAAQPTYVLRGHNAQIHSVCFLRHNTRLLTGDAEGWLVLWNVASKRAVAVWRAHEGATLGLSSWGVDKVITHGRDSKLLAWQLRESDESSLSSILPIEDAQSKRPDPWLLHSLTVNTLNFCSFASCSVHPSPDSQDDSIFVAVPGVRDSDVAVWSLPSHERAYTVGMPQGTKTGMLMALQIAHVHGSLVIVAGYESGHTCLWRKDVDGSSWTCLYMSKVHSQPILSLALAQIHNVFFTSAADAIVASHSLNLSGESARQSGRQIQTKHAGQQALTVRSDGKIFATAGWDGRMRVYSAKTMRELAVLKWHKEGCYALCFADVDPNMADAENTSDQGQSQVATLAHPTAEQKRNRKAQTTHWLAAGAKDGKVSLWDIY